MRCGVAPRTRSSTKAKGTQRYCPLPPAGNYNYTTMEPTALPLENIVRAYLRARHEAGTTNGTPLDYNRPSDYGKDLFSLYHKRIGTPWTNEITDEGLGKMGTGDLYHDWLGALLVKMGLLQIPANDFEIAIPEWNVKGHPDYLIGTSKPWSEIIAGVEAADMEEWERGAILTTLKQLAISFPGGLANVLTDLKTVSARVFDKRFMNRTPGSFVTASPHHAGQLYTYYYGLKKHPDVPEMTVPFGYIFYICRDDFRMAVAKVEFDGRAHAETEKFWLDIERHVQHGIEPAKPWPIIEDEDADEPGIVCLDWRVMFSPYLKLITGHNTKEEFKEEYEPQVRGRNAKTRMDNEVAKVMALPLEAAQAKFAELKAKKSYSSVAYRALKQRLDPAPPKKK